MKKKEVLDSLTKDSVNKPEDGLSKFTKEVGGKTMKKISKQDIEELEEKLEEVEEKIGELKEEEGTEKQNNDEKPEKKPEEKKPEEEKKQEEPVPDGARNDVERVMAHYGVSEDVANKLISEVGVENLLPARGAGGLEEVVTEMSKILEKMNGKLDKALGDADTAPEVALDPEGGKVKLPKAPAETEGTEYGKPTEAEAEKDEGAVAIVEKIKKTIEHGASVTKSVTPRPDAVSIADVKDKGKLSGTSVLKAIRGGKRFEDVAGMVRKNIIKENEKRLEMAFSNAGVN